MCKLCAYTGSGHAVFDEIMEYVVNNADRVHIDEIAAQVRTALREQLEIDMTQDEVREHFLQHQCDQKVVLNHVVRDLVEIIGVAKSNCVVLSEESGMQSMDAKNTGVYLDAVKQLMSIYKHLEHAARVRPH